MRATIDTCGDHVELTIWPDAAAGLSVLLSPAEFAALVDRGEQLQVIQRYRRERSVEAAKEAQSHHARGAA